MRLSHFFEGSLGREEVASAFLAMALESVPRFRNHFLKLITPNDYSSLGQQKWTVKVEVRQVDIRMVTADTIILIENKINAGAKQQNQLLRYYKQEREYNPKVRIILIYLAPGSIGMDEVKRVKDSPEFQARPIDVVRHLSWENLLEYNLQEGNIHDEIVRNGLDEVQRVIVESRKSKYPLEGDREIIRNIVDRARNQLIEKTGINLRHWNEGGENEQIYTAGTNVTMWLDSLFRPPHAPINVINEYGLIQLTIRSKFKLEGRAKKDQQLTNWWRQLINLKYIEIPGVGKHHLQENKIDGWFVYSREISGDEESIEKALLDTGSAVLGTLSQKLSSAGFKLSRK